MKKTLFSLLLLALLAVSCSPKLENPLQGVKYKQLRSLPEAKALTGEKLDLVPMGAYTISVVDTFFVFSIGRQPEWLAVYGLKDQALKAKLITKGDGPDELHGVRYDNQYRYVSDSVVMSLVGNSKKLVDMNLTRALDEGTASLENTLYLDGSYNSVFRRNDSVWVGKKIDFKQGGLSYPELVASADGKLQPTGNCYAFYGPIPDFNPSTYDKMNNYSAMEAIKPDGTRLVSAMVFANQLNIIDLQDGTQSISLLYGDPVLLDKIEEDRKKKQEIAYYYGVSATDSLIYALYVERPFLESEGEVFPEVRVFDWDGRAAARYTLDVKDPEEIAVTPDGKTLYVLCPYRDEEAVYKYTLN